MQNVSFFDQEMDYEKAIKSDETSETSNGDSEKEKFMKIIICQSSPCLKCVSD